MRYLFYNASVKTWDVIVIGGGIIGVSLAIELRKRGASVLVVDRGEPGHEASRAAGGMLVDSPLETQPALQELATVSAKMYPGFVRELEVESGMKVDLREFGTILFPRPEHADDPWLRPFAVSLSRVKELDPEVDGVSGGPAFFLNERSVDPRALTAAAVRTAKNRGVDFSSGDRVSAVNLSDDHVNGVTTVKTSFLGEKVVNCGGAWSSQIGPQNLPTRPVKGQMLCLAMQPRDLLKHVIRLPEVYLIPRSDGRLLVGATVEEAGFDKRTDAVTMKRFHEAAMAFVPKLAGAKILEDWAGLRPGTPDALPILGATTTPGYYVATGHFRDGILLAPVTARVMADVVMDVNPGYDIAAFRSTRFSMARV